MSAGIDWDGTGTVTERPPPEQRNGQAPRDQPSDTDAERAVLGALILAPDTIPDVAAIIDGPDFYRPAHETIWNALVDLHAQGRPADPVLLLADLQSRGELVRVGGAPYLHTLLEQVPTASNATFYAHIVAQHAAARRTIELGTWIAQAGYGAADAEQVRDRLEHHLAEQDRTAGAGQHTSWAPIDLENALAGNTDADQPTLLPRTDGPCLLYPGAVHMLSGEPTAGKTWIALHETARLLNDGQDVGFIDFEDREHRVVRRLLALGAKPDNIRAHLRYTRPHDALDGPGRADLARLATGTTLTVIDGVTEAMTLHGLDLSSNPDVATFYALLPRYIASQGDPAPAVLLIDHVVKDGERQGRWSIGGQHKVAGIDGAAYTVRNVVPFGRGKVGHSRIFIAKDRHGHVEEHALGRCAAEFHLDSTDPDVSRAALEPPEAMPVDQAGDMRPTILMEKVSRYLEINPGMSTRQVSEARMGKADFVRSALQRLVAEGYVEVRPGPRNASYHHSIDPFRKDEETPE